MIWNSFIPQYPDSEICSITAIIKKETGLGHFTKLEVDIFFFILKTTCMAEPVNLRIIRITALKKQED